MQLQDLLDAPIATLTDEQVELRLKILSQLTFRKSAKAKTTSKSTTSAPRSNKEKQAASLLKGLDPEQLKKLQEAMDAL